MSTRVAFFDPVHGIGLRIAAGSGRSWQDLPGGDPVHAHCTLDIPRDTLLPTPPSPPSPPSPASSPTPASPPLPEERDRPSSDTVFVPWADLAAFAADLEALRPGDVARLGDVATCLTVRMRRDGHLRAEAVFTVGHHVTTTVRCRTRWDWHHGTPEALPLLAHTIRTARVPPAAPS